MGAPSNTGKGTSFLLGQAVGLSKQKEGQTLVKVYRVGVVGTQPRQERENFLNWRGKMGEFRSLSKELTGLIVRPATAGRRNNLGEDEVYNKVLWWGGPTRGIQKPHLGVQALKTFRAGGPVGMSSGGGSSVLGSRHFGSLGVDGRGRREGGKGCLTVGVPRGGWKSSLGPTRVIFGKVRVKMFT